MQFTKNSGLSGLLTENSSATRLKGRSGTFDFQTDPPTVIRDVLQIVFSKNELLKLAVFNPQLGATSSTLSINENSKTLSKSNAFLMANDLL